MTDTPEPIEPELVPAPPDADALAGLDLSALFGDGTGGPTGFEGIMEMAQQMLGGAQQEAAATVVEGVSGGGAVKITATAGLEFQKVEIRKDAVDPADVELLEDLVLAALRDLITQANEITASALGFGDLLGGLGSPPQE